MQMHAQLYAYIHAWIMIPGLGWQMHHHGPSHVIENGVSDCEA